VVSTRVDGMAAPCACAQGWSRSWKGGSPIRGFTAAVRNAQKFKKMSGMTWRSMVSDGLEMRHGKELTWSQVVMAANTPHAAEGRARGKATTDAGVLASRGQVAGVLNDLPSCAELIEAIVSERRSSICRRAAALVE